MTLHELMHEIDRVYDELSPENLTADGELYGDAVAAKRRSLMAELRGLFKKVGVTVTASEAWDWVKNHPRN